MPWDVTIRKPDRTPLGTIRAVQEGLRAGFPQVHFYREPSGREKMAAVDFEFPEVLRRHLDNSPATTQGDLEGDGFSIRFFLGAEEPVERVDAEIRGDTAAAILSLERLAQVTGWRILETSSGLVVADGGT